MIDFELRDDNSAPCAKCYYFNRDDGPCNLPPEERGCMHELGTHHGWMTLEYVEKK